MSESQVIFELDQEIFDNIKKTFADKSSVEIGILESAPAKTAMVGAVHEFGTKVAVTPNMRTWFFENHFVRLRKSIITIPKRSFLALTASHKAELFAGELNAQSESLLFDIVTGEWRDALRKMGEMWSDYVKECFATRGFGTWEKLSSFTVMDKGHDEPLYRAGTLERSISSKVVAK